MANLTKAQRYNKRMDEIFEKARAEGRGLVGNSNIKGVGVNSPAMKDKAKRLGVARSDSKWATEQPF